MQKSGQERLSDYSVSKIKGLKCHFCICYNNSRQEDRIVHVGQQSETPRVAALGVSFPVYGGTDRGQLPASHYPEFDKEVKDLAFLPFTNKICRSLPKPDRKFTVNIVHGILVSRSFLITDISGQFHETIRKVNTVKRLSNHLSEGTSCRIGEIVGLTWKNVNMRERTIRIDHAILYRKKMGEILIRLCTG